MPVPSYDANPLKVLENAVLTFEVADGALETTASGNVRPAKRTITLRAWVRGGQQGTRGTHQFQQPPGTDQSEQLLTASLIDPMPSELPDGAAGSITMTMANGRERRGTVRLQFLVEAAPEYVQPILGQSVNLAARWEVSRAD